MGFPTIPPGRKPETDFFSKWPNIRIFRMHVECGWSSFIKNDIKNHILQEVFSSCSCCVDCCGDLIWTWQLYVKMPVCFNLELYSYPGVLVPTHNPSTVKLKKVRWKFRVIYLYTDHACFKIRNEMNIPVWHLLISDLYCWFISSHLFVRFISFILQLFAGVDSHFSLVI